MGLYCPIRDGKCKDNCTFAYFKTDGSEGVICGLVMFIDALMKQAAGNELG